MVVSSTSFINIEVFNEILLSVINFILFIIAYTKNISYPLHFWLFWEMMNIFNENYNFANLIANGSKNTNARVFERCCLTPFACQFIITRTVITI